MRRECCLGVLSATNKYHSQLNILVPKDTPKCRANRRKSRVYQKYITAEKVEDVNMPSCVAEQRVCFPNTPHKPKQNIERDNTIHYSVQVLARDIMPNKSPLIVLVRVSHSHNKRTPCHLTSSLLPCLLAFKNRRSSKIILRIVAPLVASVSAAATLKLDLCVSSMAPSFSMTCCRCNVGYRLHMAGWQTRSFSGVVREN